MNGVLAQMRHYEWNTNYRGSGETTLFPEAFLTLMTVILVFIIVIYVVHAYFLGRIFKKAGVESWKAWVPVYNNWTMLELGNQPGYWAILALVPIINLAAAVFMYIAMYYIGRRFGKSDTFVLFAIFLPTVWIIWLGSDSSTWAKSSADTART